MSYSRPRRKNADAPLTGERLDVTCGSCLKVLLRQINGNDIENSSVVELWIIMRLLGGVDMASMDEEHLLLG